MAQHEDRKNAKVEGRDGPARLRTCRRRAVRNYPSGAPYLNRQKARSGERLGASHSTCVRLLRTADDTITSGGRDAFEF